MSFRPIAPRRTDIVEKARRLYPESWRLCHKDYPQPEGSHARREAERFIKVVARMLHDEVDPRFGNNYSRGNPRRLSQDAVAFKNPESQAGGVEIIDVVARAGHPDQRVAWNDVTQATIDANTYGRYVEPPALPPVEQPGPDPGPDQPTDLEQRISRLEAWVRTLRPFPG